MAHVPDGGPYAPGLVDGGFAILTDGGPDRQLVAELVPDWRKDPRRSNPRTP